MITTLRNLRNLRNPPQPLCSLIFGGFQPPAAEGCGQGILNQTNIYAWNQWNTLRNLRTLRNHYAAWVSAISNPPQTLRNPPQNLPLPFSYDKEGLDEVRRFWKKLDDFYEKTIKKQRTTGRRARRIKRKPSFGRIDMGLDFEMKGELTGRQLRALLCEQFRVTLKPRREGLWPANFGNQSAAARKAAGRPERFWTIEELSNKRINKELMLRNLEGYDIYVTPISNQYHHILVDDATVWSLAQLKADGFRPALVQKSSCDNIQAILIAEKIARKDEQSLANRVLTGINKQYGDANISGVRRPFRLAPFWNKKAGKETHNTVVLDVSPGVCSKTSAMLESFRSAIPMVSALSGARAPAGGSLLFPQDNNMAETYHKMKRGDIERFVVGRGWPIDANKIDFQVARQMSAAGFKIEQIAASILACSPYVEQRHKRSRKYAIATATSAIIQGM